MNTLDASIAEQYVRLALAVDLHMPGYVDSYFGPVAWRDEVNEAGPQPLVELQIAAEALADALTTDQSLGTERREYLAQHIAALNTTLRLLQGEQMGLVEEVQALYDVTPAWTDEEVFRDAHRELDELLPPGDSLKERMLARRKMLEVPVARVREHLPYIYGYLRELTKRHFPLPGGETFHVEFVEHKSWSAYNWYLGQYRSRIDINTDLPIRLNNLVDLAAHEAYPGHHTELSIKEALLVEGAGQTELTIITINSPACVLSEGIATSALQTILPDGELVSWLQEEVFPRVQLQHVDAARMHRIDIAARKLAGLSGNAVFLLHDQGVDDATVSRYFQQYGLVSENDAAKRIEFLRDPLYRSYNFTYQNGYKLVNGLLTQKEDPIHWYGRLLAEAVTPTQVRRWLEP